MTLPDTLIEKTFSPADFEQRWYAHWEAVNAFRPERPDAKPYTIIIPPPNVTGSLHLGHALDNTLQDILIRYHRLLGRDARWVVGTDHAGIATQMVVERQLAESTQATTRQAMGRTAFLETVWDWKRTSGGAITQQLRRLGASCDWSNERFTMDEGFNKAVTKVFVTLFEQKLLYRDKRLVNWDPKLKTAISDLEVEFREVDGNLWHFRYPMEDGSGFIAIATTRPETILGDGAVAVNPDDPKMAHFVGKRCRLPLVDRLIPIITDSYVEADFGTGAVKITAAHDFNDFEVYKRHPEANIPVINLMNDDATMSDACPPEYRGLTREEARKKVIADFDALGLLDKVEPHRHQVPYGDRSGVIIEPYLTDQWYVNAAELAKPALEVVKSGATQFVPKTWEKTYYNWMENIQPWCVSRQLWWGHQIPAWYDEGGKCYVAETEEAAQAQAGSAAVLTRDEDVLDTWFSSALWPFATLGWPEKTDELARHYPGDVLVTGFDIIFFWVARMVMQGLHFMDDVPPFKTVYCHGLVRDAKGAKMSKSKGNTVDPLTLVDKYGADALRFTLTAMESQGRDIKLDEKRVEGYRNFATKLWNAARFCQSNGIGASTTVEPPKAENAVNRWIIGEVATTARALETAMATYRFDAYADAIYGFAWNRFCDWYLELTKPLLAEGADPVVAAETRAVSGWALDQILVMLHPVMPFLTEELWHKLGARSRDLIVSEWVRTDAIPADPAASADIEWLIGLVSEVRSARTELNVPPGAKLGYSVEGAGAATTARLSANAAAIERLARIVPATTTATGGKLQLVHADATYALPLEGVVDLAAEKARLEKAIATASKERDALAGRLASPGFTEKAKPEAVEKARDDHAARSAEAERLGAALARLG
ncbi:valine--tRNA ligase [Polymorphobacter glacialis]|uniref:Valine--tRNA ligase n=1 Tax=Sandarakinorhabdus glacialis TaxID=1614636 RepID=A0A917E9R9_9SPHN|nr:valine--tRNA ligase [Polymorphobacter glacialis]GGE13135.1 valine--tRNA ligase [Polymorphobacter glacialis]